MRLLSVRIRGYQMNWAGGWQVRNQNGEYVDFHHTKALCRKSIDRLMGKQHPPTKRNLRAERRGVTA